MADLTADISAFEKEQDELEREHMGEWVLFRDEKLVGVYDSFKAAAREAVAKYGRGPYLIRQVGVYSITLPASVMYRPVHG